MEDSQHEGRIAHSRSAVLKVNMDSNTGELTIKEEHSIPANPDQQAAEAEVTKLLGQAQANNWTKLFDTLCELLKEWGPYAAACSGVYLIRKHGKK